jgi:hypothetical protein
MSLIKANAVQIGQSGTATQNFTLAVPSSPDGTIKLARGNAGATTQDVISVDASGNINGLVKSTGSTTARSLANRFADVVNVKDFGAVGDGVADDTAAISLALAAGQQIVFPHGDYLITTNITVGAGKALVFNTGASVTSTTTNTLNLNNNAELVADRSRIFNGSASCTNIKTAYPEWWGAIHSTTVESNSAFQSALDALKESGTLLLNNGYYALNGVTALSITKGQCVIGQGKNNTSFRITTPQTNVFRITNTLGVCLKGFRIQNTIPATSGIAIYFEQTIGNTLGRFSLDDIYMESVYEGIYFQGNSTQTLNTGSISNVYLRSVYSYGIKYDWCENIFNYNVQINADTGTGSGAPNSGIILFNKCQTVDFTDCGVGNCSGSALFIQNSLGVISRGQDVRWCKFIGCLFDDSGNGANIFVASNLQFTNCWFSSNGRTFRGYAGNGIWIRQNTESISIIGGIISNNGQRGVRVESGAIGVQIRDVQLSGNSVNDITATAFWAIDLYGGTSNFSIIGCDIKNNGYGWDDGNSKGIQVRSGSSNNYIITNNLINVPIPNNISDNGSGTNKYVANNITY